MMVEHFTIGWFQPSWMYILDLAIDFFQFVEQHHSWGSIFISIYRIDARDLKNKSVHAKNWWKNVWVVGFNPVLLYKLGLDVPNYWVGSYD